MPPIVAPRMVTEAESLSAHLAFEKSRLERADDELWTAVRKIADVCQSLELQFAWLRCRALPWIAAGLVAAVASPWLALLLWWCQR